MKNAIFIHAANMAVDVTGHDNIGRCQEILDRIDFFINDSKIYEDVDLIYLGYSGVEGIKFDIPESKIVYHGADIYQWEFPTLHALRAYCKENKDANVLYLHTQGVSQGFHHHELQRIDERRDYHLYWNVTKYKEALKLLETHDTCGAMLVPLNADLKQDDDGNPQIIKLHEYPIWHYSQNFWWSKAKHVNTLPNPEDYPQILDERHQAEFWLCSSTEEGTHASIHDLYKSWCFAEDFAKEKYMDAADVAKFT